ncbi:kinase [Sphingomonas colocasiae]|uniref:Kinase n=1 Tax=Sphingomonas colocasiae TaxID=1848973 RepID=A0ABS7PPW3_9SPHN|nr:kinase [Sphingomonas colocasiae]
MVLGICGAQGSGKSTMSLALAAALDQAAGLRVANLSIDDFYVSRRIRAMLAADVHPLFAARGVPGTHDVGLAMDVIASLRAAAPGSSVKLPRFDKARDDVVAASDWPVFSGPADVILLEGWCVGARPQDEAALADPVNALERGEDAEQLWRSAVNARLADDYQALFAELDLLLMIAAPSFDAVFAWRREQERKLAERIAATGADGGAIMDDAAVARFIMHYERLTRHILSEMPGRADGVMSLDNDRAVRSLVLG